ncbi:ABC transporter substrate-binding protein [Halobacterium jilantaiense]|uniref:Peptide/nickel transport system substrate-binding protein n=1 Tax=Halobacterium jilantaiense TaxID=355548 RepID=A0A1I0PHC1_9EURY|nr:ABC transporter substrate-binding protein [Halobacterium jilantaiense]SEW13660.1 peptide/nickel transport system substrate-binding protein [Halobacterium jilantaiense]
MPRDTVDRRTFLKSAGAATVVATSLAGCSSGDGDSGEDTTEASENTGDGTETDETTEQDDGGSDLSGTLVYSRGDHPTNYDPQQTTSGEVAKVTNQVFDTLIDFVPGSGGQLTDGLANEWNLEETTATVTLKEGITFHNGEEVTGEDVRATVRRFIDEDYEYFLGTDNRSGYSSVTFGDWVESIEVPSEYEVQFNLSQRYAPFVRNLAMFAAAIMSKTQIEGVGATPEDQASLGTDPKGTGPFMFEELDNSNQRILLSGYQDFWGEGPNVAQVIFKTIGSNQTRAQDLINGDTHITDNLDAQSIQQVDGSGSASVVQKNGINVGYMAFNHARKEAFRDPRVKRAITLAVNRSAIVDDIYQGFATEADQPLPPDVLGHNDDLEPYPHDPEEAQSLLEEAGATDLSFELATFSNPRGYNPSPLQTANQIKSDLQEIGVSVEINQFSTFSSYIEYTYGGRHDACLLGWYTDNADPDNFLYVLLHPGVDASELSADQQHIPWDDKANASNVAAWVNKDYVELVDEGQTTYDEGSRRDLYLEASQIAHDDAPWMFIDYAELIRGVHQSVNADSYTVSSVGGPYLELVEMN